MIPPLLAEDMFRTVVLGTIGATVSFTLTFF